MTTNFYDAVKARRTVYTLSNKSSVSDDRLQELVQDAITHAPSAFNSQSSRVVLLLGDNHTALWDLTKETLKKIVPAERFPDTEKRLNGFSSGYGSVLFFEDSSVIDNLQANYPLYKDNFPVWSLESAGMLQYVVWTSLAVEGMGASLQHYNPLIDDSVKAKWNVPVSWKLLGQMPFGVPTAPAGEKTFQPIENRISVFK